MKNTKISPDIKEKLNNIVLGCIRANCVFQKYNIDLWTEIDAELVRVSNLSMENVKEIPQISSSREAYRSLGKEPARYRLSAEALHRRIINGKGLYQISNIVDVINLSSIKTGYSIGAYDASKIDGDIFFDIGKKDEDYEAIGRGKMNIDSLPVFRDDTGAFGSPTSDSTRTMINNDTIDVLLIVINFGGHDNFDEDLKMIGRLMTEYCNGEFVKIDLIS